MSWFLALREPMQLALIGAIAVVSSALISALVAVLGFLITSRAATSTNRELVRATRDTKAEETAIAAAAKQAEFRQQWIENLRAAIARFTTGTANLVSKETSAIASDKYEKMFYEIEYIELMLNMNEDTNKELIADMRVLMDKAIRPYDKINFDEVYRAKRKVSETARKILKAEWDKLRTELKTLKKEGK